MIELEILIASLYGIRHALGTGGAALVRVGEGDTGIDELVGDIEFGSWITPFLEDRSINFHVRDGTSYGDRFTETLQEHGIQFFAAARLVDATNTFICTFDTQERTLTGSDRYVFQALVAMLSTHVKLNSLLGQFSDLVTQKEAGEARLRLLESVEAQQDALTYRLYHDDLTGLRNRAFFMDRLALALQDVTTNDHRRAAIIFIDLDRFKLINDSLGHTMGDVLLVELAKRLSQCVRPTDTLARIGGDEFTVLIDHVRDNQTVLALAERFLRAFQSPVRLGSEDVHPSASLGIAFIDRRYARAEDVLRDADTAMYRAKRDGGMRYASFDEGMFAISTQSFTLQLALRRAVERGEFAVRYQPVFDATSRTLTAIEALVRWEHPDRGTILPAEFIADAEETGIITSVGEFVLRRACSDMARWFVCNPALTLDVNISPRQFNDPNFFDMVVRVLGESGLPPHALRLEVTEALFADRVEYVGALLKSLRAYGVRIALDDFGTGYSSLNYLERFDFDTVKIDRSFVERIDTSAVGFAIVRAIVDLARALDMIVIAEGVERESQVVALRSLACDQAQGYFLSEPLEAAKIDDMLRAPASSEKIVRG